MYDANYTLVYNGKTLNNQGASPIYYYNRLVSKNRKSFA
jgi:hypothetical protein